jgi:hypothetical protein
MFVLACKMCDELLVAYKRAVGLYTNAARTMPEMLGDEYPLAIKEMTSLSEACKAANDALLAHLRENHHPVNPAQETASS